MSDSNQGENEQAKAGAPSKVRGPAYPYLDLPKAIQMVEKLADAKITNKHAVAPEAIYGTWGMGVKSSAARQSLAALKYYGLVEYSGSGRERRVRLTERAMTLALDKNEMSPRRIAALKEAALAPAVFADLYREKGGPFLPPGDALALDLKLEKGFDNDSADKAVKHFITAVKLARLDEPDSGSPQSVEDGDSNHGEDEIVFGGARVGDLVQWESQGALRFEKPARVRDETPDGNYVAVEGYEAWIPMSETIVEARAEGVTPPPPPFRPTMGEAAAKLDDLPADVKRDTFATTDGDVVLQWPVGLSADSLEDVEAWTALILKKVKREIARRDAEEAQLD